MKRTVLILITLLACWQAGAQISKENVEKDRYITAGVHHPYIEPEYHDTKAPAGFKPFYVTHYGRHGSRLHTSEDFFNNNLPHLETLERKGLLTDRGLALKEELQWLQEQHAGMAGTLTVRGGREQQGVASRLIRRCPQIFAQKDRKTVTSRATPVHRVIQSMSYFNTEIQACNPQLELSLMTGDRYWDILCYNTSHLEKPGKAREEAVMDSLKREYVSRLHPEQFFKDPEAVEGLCGLSAKQLEFNLFEAAQITRTLDGSEDHDPLALFTLDDLVNMGRLYNCQNFIWFMHSIESGEVNQNAVGRPILRDILATSQAAIAGNGHCADFRFGHDSGVGPLAGLLEIGDYARKMHIWESPDLWPAYKNDCMCSNVQIILYRNRGGDVLVKVLFNEQETLISSKCKPYSGPYYRWEDFRSFVESKL